VVAMQFEPWARPNINRTQAAPSNTNNDKDTDTDKEMQQPPTVLILVAAIVAQLSVALRAKLPLLAAALLTQAQKQWGMSSRNARTNTGFIAASAVLLYATGDSYSVTMLIRSIATPALYYPIALAIGRRNDTDGGEITHVVAACGALLLAVGCRSTVWLALSLLSTYFAPPFAIRFLAAAIAHIKRTIDSVVQSVFNTMLQPKEGEKHGLSYILAVVFCFLPAVGVVSAVTGFGMFAVVSVVVGYILSFAPLCRPLMFGALWGVAFTSTRAI